MEWDYLISSSDPLTYWLHPLSPYLVHDVLNVDGLQYLGFDNSVEISIHKLKHEIDIYVIACLDDIYQLDYVVMVGKFLQESSWWFMGMYTWEELGVQ